MKLPGPAQSNAPVPEITPLKFAVPAPVPPSDVFAFKVIALETENVPVAALRLMNGFVPARVSPLPVIESVAVLERFKPLRLKPAGEVLLAVYVAASVGKVSTV